MSACATCGGPLPPQKGPPQGGGRPRKFCSQRCRKAQYDRACIDCGSRIDGTSPGKALGRCVACAARKHGADMTVWTADLIVARIREWAALHGEPPAVPDWFPPKARANGDEARALRFEAGEGYWPWFNAVVRRFGSWNAGIEAAGFAPRSPHGGDGNMRRRRDQRRSAA